MLRENEFSNSLINNTKEYTFIYTIEEDGKGNKISKETKNLNRTRKLNENRKRKKTQVLLEN